MHNPDVAIFVAQLKEEDALVRGNAARKLGHVRAASAVPALTHALEDEAESVRVCAAVALRDIGDPAAVSALIHALIDSSRSVRLSALQALYSLGNTHTLPRQILAFSGFTAQDRIIVIERLWSGDFNEKRVSSKYTFLRTRILCQAVLREPNSEASEGARAVLNWLNGDRNLLRASQPDRIENARELLRAVQGGMPETEPKTLLRGACETDQN